MSRILFFTSLLLLGIISYSQEANTEVLDSEDTYHHCLFKEKSLSVGVASPYSLGLNSFGVNARIYYNIGEHICFGPEYGYFKNEEEEVVDFDFVVHYIFETPWIGISPIAGVNYSVEKELHTNETLAKPGIVLGAAIHRNIKNVTVFAEYSKVELGIKDDFVTFGILYTFKKD